MVETYLAEKQKLTSKQIEDVINEIALITRTSYQLIKSKQLAPPLLTEEEKAQIDLMLIVINAWPSTPRLREFFEKKKTSAMITFLRNKQPATLKRNPRTVQIAYIHKFLYELNFKDAYKYPLLPHESVKCTVTKDAPFQSITAGEWITTSMQLFVDYYYRRIMLTDLNRLGLLIIHLVLIDGIASRIELQQTVMQLLNGIIRKHDGLYWTSSFLNEDRQEFRRQLLHESTVAVALSLNRKNLLANLADAPVHRLITTSLISLKTLSPLFNATLGIRNLMKFADSYFRLMRSFPHFVVDYGIGKLQSSSLNEIGHARLMGLEPAKFDLEAQNIAANVSTESELPISTLSVNSPIEPNSKNVLTIIAKRLETSLRTNNKKIISDINRLKKTVVQNEGLILQILDCCAHQLRYKKPQSVGQWLISIRNPLFANVANLEAITEPDEWEDLIERMTKELSRQKKSWSAISTFAKFLSSSQGKTFIGVGQSAASDVNAQLITYDHVRRTSILLNTKLAPEKALIANLSLNISALTGLRRAEVSGLHINDAKLFSGSGSYINVQKNKSRDLKTSNALRYAPLDAMQILFEDVFSTLMLFIECRVSASDSELLMTAPSYDHEKHTKPLFNLISKSLQEATGQPMAKFHSLRHSFCCYLLLALYYDRLELGRFKHLYPYLEDVEKYKDVAVASFGTSSTLNRFETGIVRQAMGHLSFATSMQHYFHCAELMRYAVLTLPHNTIAFSDQALLGAMGLNLNKLKTSTERCPHELLNSRVDTYAHQMQKTLEPSHHSEADNEKKAENMRTQLNRCMEQANIFLTNTDSQTASPIEVKRYQEASEWVNTFITQKAIGREVPNPFGTLIDEKARRTLYQLVMSIAEMTSSERRQVSETLKALIELQSGSYLSFKLTHEQFDAHKGILSRLLKYVEVNFEVIQEMRVGKKYVQLSCELTSNLENITTQPNHRYRFKMYHPPRSSFAHRALIWLAIALQSI